MNQSESFNKTKKHFDEIAATYAESSDGKFCEPSYVLLTEEVEKFPTGKLLDVSCGTGTVLSMLTKSPLEKYGIDFSEKMIEVAQQKVGDTAQLRVSSAEDVPFDDNTFDVLTCSFAFHHYIHPAKVLQEFRRVMKPGATLIMADPYLPQPLRSLINPLLRFSENGDYHMYGRQELCRLMKDSGFKMEDYRRIGKRSFICRCIVVNKPTNQKR